MSRGKKLRRASITDFLPVIFEAIFSTTSWRQSAYGSTVTVPSELRLRIKGTGRLAEVPQSNGPSPSSQPTNGCDLGAGDERIRMIPGDLGSPRGPLGAAVRTRYPPAEDGFRMGILGYFAYPWIGSG